MKTAQEWSTEAMYCYQIHDSDAQRSRSLTSLIRRIQLEAWQNGSSDTLIHVINTAKSTLLPIPKQLQEPPIDLYKRREE